MNKAPRVEYIAGTRSGGKTKAMFDEQKKMLCNCFKDRLERWIELLETSGSNTKGKVREEMKQFLEGLKGELENGK